MPYIGNQAVVGDSANTFKLLDDIASFTVTFDATDSGVVSIANNTLTFNNHRFVTGQKVTYNDGGGTAIGGLSDGSYFIIKVDQSTIKLASSASNAAAGTAIDLTSGAAGGSHTLKIAFDGVNTKFKATHSNGTKAKISRAAQLSLSINGVIQQPQETSSPTIGYGIEADSTIVFSTAPAATDKVFGSFIGEVAASFDLTDNTVDEFTADGSTTTFTLSKTVPSSNDVLVTLDGVTQYPTTQSNTRAYSVLENVLTFVSAPSAGVIIQVRHIGFAGASTSAVTGFYGRTGNVQLKNTDNVDVNNLTAAGTVTVTGDLNVTGDLTYDETVSRNLNVTGVATVASGIVSTGDFKIGTATTLSQDNIFTTGIITATSFVGSGANLTGVASTENIRTNTNATFLQNINVSGSTTTGSLVSSGAISGTTGTFTGDVDIADKIVHTGDTDTAIRFPSADTITAETGGNEVLRVVSDRHIVTQGLTGTSFNNDSANVKILEVTGDGTVGEYGQLNLSGNQNSSATVGAIKFINRENSNSSSGGNANSKNLATIDVYADTSDSNAGDDCGGFIRFVTKGDGSGNAERARITSSGNLQIADGDLVISTSGHGIDFSATSNTSATGASMSNELLDDYEEGTWTPTIAYQYGSVTSYNSQIGKYTKIGNMVYADFFVQLSDKGDPSGSYSYIQGFPFNHTGSTAGTGTINYFNNMGTNYSFLAYEMGGSSPTVGWLTGVVGTQATSMSYIGGGNFTNNSYLSGTLIYRVSG